MDYFRIQEYADSRCLDVRELERWHYRLMDMYGRYVVDVYIKKAKNGSIERNRVFNHIKKRWGIIHNEQQLSHFLKDTKIPQYKSYVQLQSKSK